MISNYICIRYETLIVQIYEIQNESQAELVAALGVDHVGSVVLSEAQWKDREIRSAIKVIQACGKRSSLIPLFGDVTSISRCLDYYQPDIVHFCESISMEPLDNDLIEKLVDTQKLIRQRFPEVQIMRSIPIYEPGRLSSERVMALARKFESHSDYFLTDTVINADAGKSSAAKQPVAGFIGITGRVCDWTIAAELVSQSKIPVILAGGLGPLNVADAVLKVKPFGVDSCTATNLQTSTGEYIRFQKDPEKVRQFVTAVRAAEPSITS